MRRIGLLILLLILLSAVSLFYISQKRTDDATSLYTYTIVNQYPHDRTAFTQGLTFEDGILYEGTGIYGDSTLRKIELETGNILMSNELSSEVFGEGITLCGENLIQITWMNHLGFVYDKETFDLIREFSYPTEGWGVTYDGVKLIMSDGSSTLYFIDPKTFEGLGRIEVHDDDKPVTRLNELEYVLGEIYANVWLTDRICRISPETGEVIGWIDLEGLLNPEEQNQAGVLNGIAYDVNHNRLFVTGKLWPTVFEIILVPMIKGYDDAGRLFILGIYKFPYDIYYIKDKVLRFR
jgi:glutamine cyclotransferase